MNHVLGCRLPNFRLNNDAHIDITPGRFFPPCNAAKQENAHGVPFQLLLQESLERTNKLPFLSEQRNDRLGHKHVLPIQGEEVVSTSSLPFDKAEVFELGQRLQAGPVVHRRQSCNFSSTSPLCGILDGTQYGNVRPGRKY
jgi:hypothetical protein